MATWTKQQFIDESLAEIGIDAETYSVTSNDYARALKRLDAMVATWDNRGITVGYPMHDDPANSALTEETDVPDRARDPIIYGLAVKLASMYGRQVMRETKLAARDGLQSLALFATRPESTVKLPERLPIGSGHKTYRRKFVVNVDQISTDEGYLDLD